MHQQIIKFWFEELTPQNWFENNPELDKHIASRFASVLEQAARCELFNWRDSAQRRLAEIIVLDQFSRNVYRNTPKAFAQDPLALALAQEAIRLGHDQELAPEQLSFCTCRLCTANLASFMSKLRNCFAHQDLKITTILS